MLRKSRKRYEEMPRFRGPLEIVSHKKTESERDAYMNTRIALTEIAADVHSETQI